MKQTPAWSFYGLRGAWAICGDKPCVSGVEWLALTFDLRKVGLKVRPKVRKDDKSRIHVTSLGLLLLILLSIVLKRGWNFCAGGTDIAGHSRPEKRGFLGE
jgi:hypothetical protein